MLGALKISALVLRAVAWLRGTSAPAVNPTAHTAIIVLGTALGMFAAGYVTAAATYNRAAEIAALRAEISAHEVAAALRMTADKIEAGASADAAKIEAANAVVAAEEQATLPPSTPHESRNVFDRAFLERLRRVR